MVRSLIAKRAFILALSAHGHILQGILVGSPVVAAGPTLKGTWALTNASGGANCTSPCTVTLNQAAAAGDTIVFMGGVPSDSITCADNGVTGGNTYTLSHDASGLGVSCYSINVAKSATTLTITRAGGNTIIGAVQVISGATALDGSAWAAPSTTSFATGTITPTANGVALGITYDAFNNPIPESFTAPWATGTETDNGAGWVWYGSNRTTTNGSGYTCSGTSTTGVVSSVGALGFK